MNRTQDTIILEKIFNERLELSIYKNRGQFYLTKNLRKQFRCKLRSNGMPVPLLRNGYSIFNGTKYR